jgi:hypothetical protein
MSDHDMPVDDMGNVRCEPCRPNNLEFCRWCGRDMRDEIDHCWATRLGQRETHDRRKCSHYVSP